MEGKLRQNDEIHSTMYNVHSYFQFFVPEKRQTSFIIRTGENQYIHLLNFFYPSIYFVFTNTT